VLIGLAFGIPAFGVYVMFLVPIMAQTMTRDIKVSQSWSSDSERPADQNITILFVCVFVAFIDLMLTQRVDSNTSGILTHPSKLLRRAALRQMPASLGSG
jgi:Na+/citrate or Na+/malate symporter